MICDFRTTLGMFAVATIGVAACGRVNEASPGAGGGAPAEAPAAPSKVNTPGRAETHRAAVGHRCAMMDYRHCDGPAGGPPCETRQQRPEALATPPVTDEVTRETWPEHQSSLAHWALALAHCGEVEPQFDAQDRLADLWLGGCAEAQRFHFVFSDCQ